MTQKKTDEMVNGLLDEIARLNALIEQLKSEIHTANLERYKHD
jgi:hypothetical protein